MNWKKDAGKWRLHFEMTFTEIPGQPDNLMSEVLTRAPIRKKIIPPEIYESIMSADGEVPAEKLKTAQGILSQYTFIISLFKKGLQDLKVAMGDRASTLVWLEMAYDTSAGYAIPGIGETLWNRQGTILRHAEYGAVVVLGEIYSVNPFPSDKPKTTGFVPVLRLGTEGPEGFSTVICTQNDDISLFTKADWLAFTEKWTTTDARYLLDTLMTVRLPF